MATFTSRERRRPENAAVAPGARRFWVVITAAEVAIGAAAVVLDVGIPTLMLLAMACISVLARHTGFGSLGFTRAAPFGSLALKMLAFAAVWSLFQLGVAQPIANHLSGQEHDVSAFEGLQGNISMLLVWLALGWTLAAVGEETAYRGYLQTRMREVFGAGPLGLFAGVIASSLLFGIAHTEQGLVGVLAVTVDGIAFSVLRYRYRTLWASVLAHGFNNTIGFVTFFIVGPVGAFW